MDDVDYDAEIGESVLQLAPARNVSGDQGPSVEAEASTSTSNGSTSTNKKKRPNMTSRGTGDSASGDEDGKTAGRRKIQIEYIQDKSRRHITFSKRKAGIMKKAYELSTLTGTQVLLLVVSETGTVYSRSFTLLPAECYLMTIISAYTTGKLQPLVTETEGKNLIRECLVSDRSTGIGGMI